MYRHSCQSVLGYVLKTGSIVVYTKVSWMTRETTSHHPHVTTSQNLKIDSHQAEKRRKKIPWNLGGSSFHSTPYGLKNLKGLLVSGTSANKLLLQLSLSFCGDCLNFQEILNRFLILHSPLSFLFFKLYFLTSQEYISNTSSWMLPKTGASSKSNLL